MRALRRLIVDLARGLAALVGLAALLVAPPILLTRYVGWPLPSTINVDDIRRALGGASISDAFLIKTLAVACWAAWAQVLLCTVVECAAWVRGRAATSVPLGGLVQPLVRQLVVTGALLLGPIRSSIPLPITSPVPVVQITPEVAVASPSVPTPGPVVDAQPRCVVQRRDSLWLLAERHLGDGLRWREIYNLNRGQPQPGGRTLRDPDLIRPGWILRMPADAIGLTAPAVPAPSPTAQPVPPEVPAPPTPGKPAPADPAAPAEPAATPPSSAVPAPTPEVDTDLSNPVDDPADDDFPVPPALAGATLLAAGVVLTIDRLRRRQMRRRSPGRTIPLPSGETQAAERLFRAAAATRPASRLDLALRLLGHQLARAADNEATRIDAVRVDGDQIEILLNGPVKAPSGPFESTDGHVWTLRADVDGPDLEDIARRSTAPSPALVTIGHLNGSPVLIDLETEPLTIAGDPGRAAAFIWSLAIELATSVWADDLRVVVVGTPPPGLAGLDRIETVTDFKGLIPQINVDEQSAEEALAATGQSSRWSARLAGVGDAWTPTIILVTPDADPEPDLAPPPGVGLVRWEEAPSGRTRKLILGEAQDRLEPLGLDLDHAGLVEGLVGSAAEVIAVALSDEPGQELTTPPEPTPAVVSPPPPPSSGPIDLRSQPAPFDPAAPDPDRVLVRILGPVRIEGAKNPIQRRRIKELIVYLALHPEGVTDEQIMIALWPGETPTRSAFNQTVSRARAALGTARDGQPIIPYVESGLYRPSSHLVSDIQLLEGCPGRWEGEEGTGQDPFSGTEGFEWAYVEGHAHRASALLERARTVAGACQR